MLRSWRTIILGVDTNSVQFECLRYEFSNLSNYINLGSKGQRALSNNKNIDRHRTLRLATDAFQSKTVEEQLSSP